MMVASPMGREKRRIGVEYALSFFLTEVLKEHCPHFPLKRVVQRISVS